MRSLNCSVVVALLLTGTTVAADHPIRGRRFSVQDSARPDVRTIRVHATDEPATALLAGDPLARGATLVVVAEGDTAAEQTFVLPPGAGVVHDRSPGWRVRRRNDRPGHGTFTWSDPAGRVGPVRHLRLARRAGRLRLDVRLVGHGPNRIDVGPPNLGTRGGVVLTFPGGDVYCAALGGGAGGTIVANGPTRFHMRSATVGMCPPRRPAASFVTFESEHVRPLALSPDGTQLFAVNTPDARLEIFDIGSAGVPHHVESVPVGLEPVSVAARTAGEVWVVNHVSDSISIVDVAATPPRVTRTLLTCDEPRDLVFAGPGGRRAFVTTARRGQNCRGADGLPIDPMLTTPGTPRALVQVFDAMAPGAPLGGTPVGVVELFGDTPRALASTAGGDTVYAAVFHSGNRTTTVNEQLVCDGGGSASPCSVGETAMPGGLPAPNPYSCRGELQPETGLVVRYDVEAAAWQDVIGRDWSAAVRFGLPDLDVFAIDAVASPPVERRPAWSGVGTLLFAMAVNPLTGRVYVSNTEANNLARFEGDRSDSCTTSTVRGHLHEARITVLDGAAVVPRHLNKHLMPYDFAPSAADKVRSIATPLGMATDGISLWVAAFGSGAVAVFDVAALEADTFVPSAASHVPVTGGGASGIVLDGKRVYVSTRFDNGVSVIDTATRTEIAHVRLHDREPTAVRSGRPFLYDAVATSDNGEASCAACHAFGDLDGLAWDLGDPDGVTSSNGNPMELDGQDASFRALKGPMTTQSLRGMANHGPMHWRGDRTAAHQGGDALDETAAFLAFNAAFVGLIGRNAPLAAADMQAFADFILQVNHPPNPIRNLDGSFTPAQARGRKIYFDERTDGVRTCDGCHVLDPTRGLFGTDGDSSFDAEPQVFKIPHLRNLYAKVGMFGMAAVPKIRPRDNAPTGDQVRGFGFLHDGSIDTLGRFLTANVFTLSVEQARDVEQFLLAFDSTLAPIVGQQVTLTPAGDAAAAARADLFLARAATATPECDVVVHGVLDGAARGWIRLPGGEFRSDRSGEPLLTEGALRAQATVAGQERTYTCVPPGSGMRLGIDRDQDGCADGDDPAPADAAAGCAG